MATADILGPSVGAQWMGSERRRYARRPAADEQIEIELGTSNRAKILDLSEGGLRVQASHPVTLPPDALASFLIPGSRTRVTANCAVVWSEASGMAGLRFLVFSGGGRSELKRWLLSSGSPAEKSPTSPRAKAKASPPEPVFSSDPRPAEPAAQGEGCALEDVVRTMMAVTASDGAAIALRRGEDLVCCATGGRAPEMGAILDPDRGLSGACLRAGEPVLCRDTETDSRVNPAACRALALRAALLVPVKRDGRVEGMLQVFSSREDVFDIGDLLTLLRLADAVAGLEMRTPREAPGLTALPAPEPAILQPTAAVGTEPPVAPPGPDPGETRRQTGAEQEAVSGTPRQRPESALSKPTFRLVTDPNHRRWKLAVYWSVKVVRKLLSALTLTVPLSYVGYFLLGPVIRPAALQGTAVMAYMSAVVEPGMTVARDFFAFRAVLREWNFMFLVLAVVTLVIRSLALHPVLLALRKAEDLTRPKKHYAYVPYWPHRTEYH